jgi:hypothetical protein
MKRLIIAYFAIIGAIIALAIIVIKYFLWWDGFIVILGILSGIGFFVSQAIWEETKNRRTKK